jgi:hypothetical protein
MHPLIAILLKLLQTNQQYKHNQNYLQHLSIVEPKILHFVLLPKQFQLKVNHILPTEFLIQNNLNHFSIEVERFHQ